MYRLIVLFILCLSSACSTGKYSHCNRLKLVRVLHQNASEIEVGREAPSKKLRITEPGTEDLVLENVRESHEILLEEIGTHPESETLIPGRTSHPRAFSSWKGLAQKSGYLADKHEIVRKKSSDPLVDLFLFMMDENPWIVLLTLVVVALLILGLIYLPIFTAILLTIARIALVVGAIVVLILLIVGFCNDFQTFWNR